MITFFVLLCLVISTTSYLLDHKTIFGNESSEIRKENDLIKKWSFSNKANENVLTTISKYNQGKYELLIDFQRASCDISMSKKISSSSHYEQMVKQLLGPDEIVIHIEGKQLISSVAKFISCGKYHLIFHLLYSGAYHIKVTQLRTDYSALNELIDYPPISYQYLVNDWVMLSDSKHKDSTCHKATFGAWVEKVSDKDKPSSSLFDAIPTTLSGVKHTGGDDRGDTLPLESYVAFDAEHFAKGCVNSIDKYSFEPLSGCAWSHVTQTEASKLLSNRKIAIAGDSHMRTFGTKLLEFACNITSEPFKKGTYTDYHIKEDQPLCAGLHISYSANYWCDPQKFNWQPWKTEEFIVYNCGHHLASAEHTPFDILTEKLANIVTHSKEPSHGHNTDNFIWLESNPQPIRNDKFVDSSKDWRTEQRLYLYNQYSNNFFVKHNYSVIYAWNALLPLYDSGCDMAHFTARGALYPQFVQLFEIIKRKPIL